MTEASDVKKEKAILKKFIRDAARAEDWGPWVEVTDKLKLLGVKQAFGNKVYAVEVFDAAKDWLRIAVRRHDNELVASTGILQRIKNELFHEQETAYYKLDKESRSEIKISWLFVCKAQWEPPWDQDS
jgi:hypothetical protein